jgi:nitrogen permease regulator 3-like protein
MQSSKLSRLTAENNHYTIEEDEDHHDNEFDRDEDDDRTGTSPPLWRRKQHSTEWEAPLFGLTKRDLADILIPKALLCNRKFELGVEDLVFLGHPVHIPLGKPAETAVDGTGSLATSPSDSIRDEGDVEQVVRKVGLSKFHVVFVMNPSWRLDYLDQVHKMYDEVIKKFVEACKVEQEERAFISLEAYKIHRTMREAEDKGLATDNELS